MSDSAYCGYVFRSNPTNLELGDESKVPSVAFITGILPGEVTDAISRLVRSAVRDEATLRVSKRRSATTLNGRFLGDAWTMPESGANQMVLRGRRKIAVLQ